MGISENIKFIRSKYNLSQKELGEIAGVTDKAVSSWETGEKEPRMGAIQKIANRFGLKKSDIIEDDGIASKAQTQTGYYLDPETARLAQEIYDNPEYRILFDATKKLKPESIKEIMKFIDYQKAKERGDIDE